MEGTSVCATLDSKEEIALLKFALLTAITLDIVLIKNAFVQTIDSVNTVRKQNAQMIVLEMEIVSMDSVNALTATKEKVVASQVAKIIAMGMVFV